MGKQNLDQQKNFDQGKQNFELGKQQDFNKDKAENFQADQQKGQAEPGFFTKVGEVIGDVYGKAKDLVVGHEQTGAEHVKDIKPQEAPQSKFKVEQDLNKGTQGSAKEHLKETANQN